MHLTLDETTGVLAADASGSGASATLLGGLDFDTGAVAGIRDGALAFDDVDDAADVGVLDLTGTTALNTLDTHLSCQIGNGLIPMKIVSSP